MSIDRNLIGLTLPIFKVDIRRERLQQFANAIGASASSESAPPTYMKVIEGENGGSRQLIGALGIDLRRVLHTEQEFQYHLAIRDGDEIYVERRLVDVFDRKNGELEFLVIESTLRNAQQLTVGRSVQWIVVRNTSSPKNA